MKKEFSFLRDIDEIYNTHNQDWKKTAKGLYKEYNKLMEYVLKVTKNN